MAGLKGDVSELEKSYDYIVVGGGTSGLTVADRLSEDGTKTILVVEYGYLDDSPNILMPSPANNDRNMSRFFDYMTTPQKELNNQTTVAYAAAIVGGGSAVDHMMFDRGAAEDYDNWEKLGNPGWGWNGILPYFQKSVTFTPPTAQQQKEIGYTYDEKAAYGGEGPIQCSYPPFQWPQQKIQWNAWRDLGIKETKEGAGGEAVGLFWIPSALNTKTMTRSYSRNAHYDRAATRKNFHLLPGYKVLKIEVSKDLRAEGITIQSRDGNKKATTTISASQEVVLAAGAFGSPALLQRSGVGPKDILKAASVEVKLDLPGVGRNLQDHAGSLLLYTYSTNTVPNSAAVSNNATFAAEVQAQYTQNKTGPLTVGYGNSVVFLPLQTFEPNYESLIKKVTSQNSSSYLPSEYETTLFNGFKEQKALLAASYASKHSAMLEVFFNGDPTAIPVLQKPLSRGTVHLNSTDPLGPPIIDPKVFSNPIDMDIMTSMFKYVRKWMAAPSQASLGPVEIVPGSAVVSDADIVGAIRQFSTPSIGHALGTCAMMPLDMGGVVGSDLKVHGVEGLSIVDASVMPLAPATHLLTTVYAVAEKAADLIKARAKQ
ncbi:alcohol oxidase [Tricladium varicosporioides]|nr:alcohol oxidase [Hymenoscyphus varicosporioides]